MTKKIRCAKGGCERDATWLRLSGHKNPVCAGVASDCLCTDHWTDLRIRDPDEAYRYTPAHVVFPDANGQAATSN